MDPSPANLKAFNHARWRVRFTSHLVQTHERMENRTTPEWKTEHLEFLNRYAEAKEKFALFPFEWSLLYPAQV